MCLILVCLLFMRRRDALLVEAIICLILLRLLLVRREDALLVEAIICLILLRLLLVRREDALLVEVIICLSLLSLLHGRRKILRLYRLTPSLLSTVNVFYNSQASQSRDAKFCVSQGRLPLLIEGIICLILLRLLLVRRKVLRLYWLTPSLLSTVNVFYNSQASQSRDAKSCVSQARTRY